MSPDDIPATPPLIAEESDGERSTNPIDWKAIAEDHSVSEEFVKAASRVFEEHAEVLRRLA
jgi:hypothetical protein